ncbi:ATP-utilizing chromatin assembly and remodelling N-terminal-domain-containing protein [Mariannaea sp. PMI_226]|nr:ATP-utilizing chromatin assembly and remodelling N-terminal-domain-containing protein [Mariannaea sp. PMI_226]
MRIPRYASRLQLSFPFEGLRDAHFCNQVWHIPQTGEIFTSYEDYLNRMDFYRQRRFNDQITGHSGLTFFEAFKSELAGGKEVEASFPEALKGPVLRKIQFQTVSRLDNLVDQIFDEFKQEYFPGEEVTVTLVGGERAHGLVRDKTTFGPRTLPDGTHGRPTTRYFVNVKGSQKETVVTDEHICRDRGIFTKAMLRSFIKKTVSREAWNGAPWVVIPEYAVQYNINSNIPTHLQYKTKVQERKQLLAQKRAGVPHETNGHGPALIHSGPMRLPELKPAPKSKTKPSQADSNHKGLKWPLNMPVHGGNPTTYRPSEPSQVPVREPTPPPPPPPPPKYPIEDLLLEPRGDRKRPPLKYLCHNPPVPVEDGDAIFNDIDMDSIGPLLETWDTLNVYCEVFKLDSFTFDDFVETMSVASEQVPVHLFDEIHCSVLKVLVDSEADGGKVRITLPEIEEEDSDEDDEDDEDESTEPTPEPEPKPVGRATRSSLARLEAERLAAELAAEEKESEAAEAEAQHRAEELLEGYDWIEHLRKRDFANGGWERIMVGLLHQLSKNENQQDACAELLHQLVPSDVEPTQETVRQAYSELNVNYRVKALQIICMLTMETKAVRGFMEDCSDIMTQYRKEKIEWQRQRKQAVEDLRQLNEKRKILLPENMPPSPPQQKAEQDVKMTDVDESLQMSREEDGDETEEESAPRVKRRKTQIAAQQRRREEQARKEKEKAERAPKLPAQSKQFIKLLKDIQKKEDQIKNCEDEIATLDNDLREADCPRTRVLGKDRFWNRYYWFERNGMPYGGLPNSSTASAEYANGCIWVQGPDTIEREGYIDLPPDAQEEYRAKFNMTVLERKAMEEGRTSVFNAHQWGYICEPEHVGELIKWLDPRGLNELKLRKELLNYKDRIAKHMENRKAYLAPSEEAEKKEETNTKRMSTRIREKTPEPPNYRCLHWENTMALEELGHFHSDPPPPPRSKKGSKKRESVIEAAAPAPKSRKRRG